MFKQAVEEIGRRHVQSLGHFPQTGRRDPVCPGLVLLDLLELDSNPVGKLLLGHTHEPAALPELSPDVKIN